MVVLFGWTVYIFAPWFHIEVWYVGPVRSGVTSHSLGHGFESAGEMVSIY